jgi:hypothetical protein
MSAVTAAVASNEVAAVFSLNDPAERFMVGAMLRFHGEERLYAAHALKRTEGIKGRVIVEIASFNPPDRLRTYMLILWEIDTQTIRFKDCEDMKAARATFDSI